MSMWEFRQLFKNSENKLTADREGISFSEAVESGDFKIHLAKRTACLKGIDGAFLLLDPPAVSSVGEKRLAQIDHRLTPKPIVRLVPPREGWPCGVRRY